MSGTPNGSEAHGLPDNGRDRTEVVLEKAMPKEQQRKPQTGEGQGKTAGGKTPKAPGTKA